MNEKENQGGFTLIESLTAMVVLGIGILGFFTVHITMTVHNNKANTRTLASAVVASQIERIRLEKFSELVNGTYTDPQTKYVVNWNVLADVPVIDAKTIKLSVSVPNSGPNIEFEYVRHNDGT